MTHTYAITGATGSLGTALTHHLLAQGHKVRAIARNQHGHEKLERSLPLDQRGRLSCLVGDILDKDRLTLAFDGADYVIHAAAAKVIPLCEYSPIEAIRTNIDGMINAALASVACQSVKRAVFVSSDKAASPANSYGASKLLGERVWLRSNSYIPASPKFVAVRYANVFGSSGSVMLIWREQAAAGKKLTVTDPSATRFHLQMADAVALVLRVLHHAAPGELWVPKLPTYNVGDLARVVADGAPIDVTGIRPGEKIHETMVTEHESLDARDEGDHYVLTPGIHQSGGGWTFHSGTPVLRMSRERLREEVAQWERSSSQSAPTLGGSAQTISRTPIGSSTL